MKTTRTSLAPTTNKVERLKRYIKTTTKTERLLFACCVYYVGAVLMFKIMEL